MREKGRQKVRRKRKPEVRKFGKKKLENTKEHERGGVESVTKRRNGRNKRHQTTQKGEEERGKRERESKSGKL